MCIKHRIGYRLPFPLIVVSIEELATEGRSRRIPRTPTNVHLGMCGLIHFLEHVSGMEPLKNFREKGKHGFYDKADFTFDGKILYQRVRRISVWRVECATS